MKFQISLQNVHFFSCSSSIFAVIVAFTDKQSPINGLQTHESAAGIDDPNFSSSTHNFEFESEAGETLGFIYEQNELKC